ncbi:MAG: hypothetical protein HN348_10535 [Proteobacteria bacterium]|nr:hypothetical protein [Pseudomonadota bacterium]
MVILGIGDGVDAGAALVVDSELVAVAYQERHDQVSRSRSFPWAAVEEVLEEAGIRNRDVDLITVAGRFTPPFFVRRHPGLRAVAKTSFSAALDAQVFFQAMLRQSGLGAFEADRAAEWLEQRFRSRGFVPQRVVLVDVHKSLAEAAYRTQPDYETLVMTVHPMGDGVALAVRRGLQGQLDLIWEQKGFAALHVHLQRCITAIGLQPLVDEHRLWALAGRGAPDAQLLDMLKANLHAQGLRLSRRSYPIPAHRRQTIYQALKAAEPEVAAASVYENLRWTICGLIKNHLQEWGASRVVLGGAIFDNPRLCGDIARVEGLKGLWVGPNPGWASLPVGAAVTEAGIAPAVGTGHLGRQYGRRQCERALTVAGISFEENENPTDIAALLVQGGAVARFSNRAGSGRFGLGSRSVLVRGDDVEAVARVRATLKRPEDEEPGCLWVDGADDGLSQADLSTFGDQCRFGTVAPLVGDAFAKKYPALVTSDGRAHLQQVFDEDDPGLRAIIQALIDQCGCGALACFPLARKQDPVVAVPGDAVRVFQASGGLSALAIGPYLVSR